MSTFSTFQEVANCATCRCSLTRHSSHAFTHLLNDGSCVSDQATSDAKSHVASLLNTVNGTYTTACANNYTIAGAYIDSVANAQELVNYRESTLENARYPPVFDTSGRPVVLMLQNTLRFLNHLSSSVLAPRGGVLMGNGPYYPQTQYVPLSACALFKSPLDIRRRSTAVRHPLFHSLCPPMFNYLHLLSSRRLYPTLYHSLCALFACSHSLRSLSSLSSMCRKTHKVSVRSSVFCLGGRDVLVRRRRARVYADAP